MRRWNGWGDDGTDDALTERTSAVLARIVGPPDPARPKDAALEDVVAAIPPARLPRHPLVDDAPETRLRRARGQSLPDWLALRTGRPGQVPDGVAFPETRAQVRDLLAFAASAGARVIPYGGGTSVVGGVNPTGGDAAATRPG